MWTAPYADRRPALALAALVMSLPLAVRRRYPIPAFAATWAGVLLAKQAAPGFDEQSLFFTLIVVFALFSLGANTRGRAAWSAA